MPDRSLLRYIRIERSVPIGLRINMKRTKGANKFTKSS